MIDLYNNPIQVNCPSPAWIVRLIRVAFSIDVHIDKVNIIYTVWTIKARSHSKSTGVQIGEDQNYQKTVGESPERSV